MATPTLEIIIPLAVAAYAGWTDWSKCTGPTDPTPVVETFCGPLRDSLNDACTSMLSVPIAPAGLQLTAKRKVSPIEFNDLTKKSIRATYEACKGFWGGRLTYEQYMTELAEKASVLNMLYAALPASPSKPANPLTDTFASTNVSRDKIAEAEIRTKANADNCSGAELTCQQERAAQPHPSKEDIEASERRIGARLDELSRQIAELSRRPSPPEPGPSPSPVASPWRLVTEVSFRAGSAALDGKDPCTNIAGRFKTHVPTMSGVLVRVVGYADGSGTADQNQVLSEKRAAVVARCLVEHGGVRPDQTRSEGAGVVPVPIPLAPQVRRATIYIQKSSTP